jgi:hypothetical protein
MPRTPFKFIPLRAFVSGYAGWRAIKVDDTWLYYDHDNIQKVKPDDIYDWLEDCDSWDWEPEPQYREPTQADVGKLVEVRDSDDQPWGKLELLAVLPADIKYRFLSRYNEGRFHSWKYARIKDNGTAGTTPAAG